MVDVQKREDRLLDAISVYKERRDLTLLQLRLCEYAYPELLSVWSELRCCLEGADDGRS